MALTKEQIAMRIAREIKKQHICKSWNWDTNFGG